MSSDLAPSGLARAAQMLERMDEVLVKAENMTAKMPALQMLAQVATAHALVGVARELAAVHDQLTGIESAFREAHGLEERK